ncbi:F-box/LRR-repeat protein 7-like isoform X1 [Temnothorax curvispinosus]|uniref:F-box/LRR-repeat protein 7-like isoform X1 n=2 Tax=Temnothorax curvispinosus TaxID=300111 RepID=A0A6J1R455_9HYME|nr:F-box/LRR-repeat protein 7-like isoform X1 [Temnothorax curvispinosus]
MPPRMTQFPICRTEHGMEGSCPLLFPSFGEQSGSERGGGYSQKVGVYRPGADAIDLGYHTLDNNACRTTSSSSSSTPGVSSTPIRQQQQQQQLPQPKHHLVYHVAVNDLCQLDDNLLLRIFSWLDTRDRCSLAQTCRRLWEIAWHPALWREVEVRYPQNATAALYALTRRGCHTCVRRLVLEGATGLPGIFAQLPYLNLTSLVLRHSRRVTDANVTTVLDSCAHLRELDLTGCPNVTRACGRTTILQLQSLDLSDCHGVEDSGLVLSLSRMPHLGCLYLRRCGRITDASLVAIASYCASLRQLSVSDCVKVTDFGVREVAARLGPSLRYFSVGKCDRVSDAGLLVVARHCYKLRYLNARGCEALSDSATIALARGCPRMRALDIGKCDIGDATLEALSTGCPNLKKLSLCGCERITDAGLEALAYYVRGLRQLNIGECPRVTWVGYRAVKRYCRRCVIEHTNPGFSS